MTELICVASHCVSQQTGITTALVTSFIALIGVIAKIGADYYAGATDRDFQQKERVGRQAFEDKQRRATQEFQQAQILRAAEAEARTKAALEEFVRKKKWREERRDQRLALLHAAAGALRTTTDELATLVEMSPAFDDLQMISETARVLDSLPALKVALSHISLPGHFSDAGKALLDRITRLLLTLSPDRSVRQQPERKERLARLVQELRDDRQQFEMQCRRYEDSPGDFE